MVLSSAEWSLKLSSLIQMHSTKFIILPSVSNDEAKYLPETIINHVFSTIYKKRNESIIIVMSINYHLTDKNNF